MGAERLNVAHDFGGHGGGAFVQADVNQSSDPNLDFSWRELDHRQAFKLPLLTGRPQIFIYVCFGRIRKGGNLGGKLGPRERCAGLG